MSNLCMMSPSLLNLGPRIWNSVPDKLKQVDDVYVFKKEIKIWNTRNCPCRLCKTCIPNVCFIQSFRFALVFETHPEAAHQKRSYEGSFSFPFTYT